MLVAPGHQPQALLHIRAEVLDQGQQAVAGVGVHVGYVDRKLAVVVVVADAHAHREARTPRQRVLRALLEAPLTLVLPVTVGAEVIAVKEVEVAVEVEVEEARDVGVLSACDAPFVERPRNRRRSHSVVFNLPSHVVNDVLL